MTDLRAIQNLGRAKNALQAYLVRKLLVPKIYLDVEWNGSPVDVLAIDRSGVGDVHAVRTVPLGPGDTIRAALIMFACPAGNPVEGFKSLPSHFRYLAIVGEDPGASKFNPRNEMIPDVLFAEDGVGRIGILYVDPGEEEPSVQVLLKAERFRSSKEIVELADRFVAEHTPNWEFRDPDSIEPLASYSDVSTSAG